MGVRADLGSFLPDARAFLAELEANNARDWFNANKARYDTVIKRPGQALLEALEPALADWSGAPVRTKLFRPHRDVRFSRDTTPYHVHLHLLWSCGDGRGWFFGLAPTYATAGAGIMVFDEVQLDRFRAAVENPDEGATLRAALATARVDPPALKRVPAPYPRDHPCADLLRHKGLVAWQDGLDDALSNDPIGGLHEAFALLRPVQDWLMRIA